ncbi:TlpA family protein disulfide reductase [Elizabethkingia occulta]|uniref:TlpA family protein disulfide reductase n=1 Tax=Elizabethkingia occulta TaxID=1867263 RepID=UPI00398C557E
MSKFITLSFALVSTAFVYANDIKLENTRQKYNSATSISYRSTAFYPNPDTDEITTSSVFYTIYNLKNMAFDFHSQNDDTEEIYKNGIYTEIKKSEKAYYQYENKQNQDEAMQSSRLAQYGPVALLKHKWKHIEDISADEKLQSHYSFIEDEHEYKGKIIKTIFHLYITPDNSISKFERKSYVDNKLGQTVTYIFSNYTFSNKKEPFNYFLPRNYSLKYFERIEQLKPLKENTGAPLFEAIDINGNKVYLNTFPTESKLLLFSSTNCGASKVVNDYVSQADYALNNNITLINIFSSDSVENVTKYFRNKQANNIIITNRKDLETGYGISGYPVLYMIDKEGIITKVADGSDQVISLLKEVSRATNK